MSYPLNLLRRSRHLFVTLVKVMLPVMVLVHVGQQLGWVDALGRSIAPAMAWLDLPPEAGMIWVATIFVGVYGGIAAFISFAPDLHLSAAQLSALCAMMLFAHALPVEQAIVRRAGGSFWGTAALRLTVAIAYGGAVAWMGRLTGVLAEPVSLAWLAGTASADSAGAGSFMAWVEATALSLVLTFAIIVGLLVLLDALERLGITRRITAALTPLLRFSGLEPRAAPVTTVGVMLGLTYGGALIIEEAERQQFPPRTRTLALSWLSLSHALIEDTALVLALGANAWIVLVGRVLATLLVMALMARLLGMGAPPACAIATATATDTTTARSTTPPAGL